MSAKNKNLEQQNTQFIVARFSHLLMIYCQKVDMIYSVFVSLLWGYLYGLMILTIRSNKMNNTPIEEAE